jgi:hypothetical protein
MLHEDKDLLWDELNLGGLVNSIGPAYGLADRVSMNEINKSKILKKHNDMVQKPTYTAIMGRYETVPSKPKSIQSKKLDLLADPIKGRFSRIEKFLGNLDERRQNLLEGSLSPSKKSSGGVPKSPRSPTKTVRAGMSNQPSGFFLTGGDDGSAEPDNESSNIEEPQTRYPQYGRSRNGLAAALRGRVGEARKEKAPIGRGRAPKRTDPLQKRKPGAPAANSRAAPRKEWKDNTHVNYLSKNKGVNKKTGILGEDYKERRDLSNRRGAAENKGKVLSSGYGYNRGSDRNSAQPAERAPLPQVCVDA